MQTIEQLIINTYKASVALRNAGNAQIIKTLEMLADAVEDNTDSILMRLALHNLFEGQYYNRFLRLTTVVKLLI